MAPSTPSDALHAAVDLRLLYVAYERLLLSLVLTLIVTALFVGLMSSFLPGVIAAIWAGSIVASTLGRLVLWGAFRREQPGADEVPLWRSLNAAGAAATGLAWSIGPVMAVLAGISEPLPLLVGTLISVCAVAMNALAAQRGAMQAFIIAALAPFTVAVALQGDRVDLVLAMVMAAGMTSLVIVGRASSRGMRTLIGAQLELQASAEEARAARERAEAASRAKTSFLANMSHELRTPLNAVIGAAQLLRAERADAERQAQLVDAIERSGTGLLGLIENVLDLSRIEARELALRPADFDLVECIESALASCALTAQAKGLRLSGIVSPRLVAWRHGDADRMRQIVTNLLGNALKFTATGEITVDVQPRGRGERVSISVSDTGIGIASDALAHVFEPFRQADEGAARRYGGSGLGLAIVRELVDAMEGTIDVQSTPGAGSCFTFEVPLPVARSAPAEPPPLNLQVLLHEPHDASAAAMAARLLRLGCEVARCDDAACARHWMATHRDAPSPWIVIDDASPQAEALLAALAQGIDPARVIVLTDRSTLEAERARDTRHPARPLLRPVTLPALRARLQGTSMPEAGAAFDVGGGGHVLVVEDDDLNRSIVTRMLLHAGHRVSSVADGPEAIEWLARSGPVDLVLMDWQMPAMDGLEVTRRMRAGEAGPQGLTVPVVALTANAFAEDREACLAAGMNDFLTKPVQASILLRTIQRWCAGADPAATAAAPAATAPRGSRPVSAPEAVPTHAPSLPLTAPPAPAPANGLRAFDPGVLATLPMVADGSDPDCARELIQSFVRATPARIADIARARADGNGPALLRAVHTLKSGAATVGALELAALAAAAERTLRTGQGVGDALPADLGGALQRLHDALPPDWRPPVVALPATEPAAEEA